MTNVLSFDVSNRGEGDATLITACVDEVMLTALAAQFERSHGMDPAGGYSGLIPEFFCYGPLDRYFLGRADFLGMSGRIYVLGCECGEVGCWPLECLVNARDREVIWEGFKQPHRPERDYSSFGPFVFKLEQYEEALRSLPK